MVKRRSLAVAHTQACRTIKQAAARGPQPVALATDVTQEPSRVKQEPEEKNAQLQFFKEIACWGSDTTADARESQPACAPLSVNTTPVISNRRSVLTRAARGVREAAAGNMEARERRSFWWCRLCALMCGTMLVVAFFGCFALCESRDSFKRSISTLNGGSGGSSTARVSAIPTSAKNRWWVRDKNIRHGTTLQESSDSASAVVTDRTRKDGECIRGGDVTSESDSKTQDVTACSSSGELVRQDVCSRCAAAWMVWDSASVLSLTLLNSVRISLRDVDFSVQNFMLLGKVTIL